MSEVNPTCIRHAGLMPGRGNKTDEADARLIAAYTARERPPAWCPPPPAVRELRALARRADELVELVELSVREKGWLTLPALAPAVRKSVERTVRLLAKETARPRAAADAAVAASDGHVGAGRAAGGWPPAVAGLARRLHEVGQRITVPMA